MAKPTAPSVLQRASKARTEANQAFKHDLGRRLQDQGRILSADDLSGMYDAGRLLFTTMGGVARPLTVDDLKQFRHQSRQLGKKYRGGITPKQVIDLSLAEDRERANKQIRAAIPVSAKGGVLHFQTNAGPGSDKQRHHVYVELLNYGAAVASPKQADKIVKEMLAGPVKFDCDCGRHTFWFRYVATIGRYNYGRAEDGYPKIRNPQLHGVACKHVLRVMQLLTGSPTFRGYAAKMVEQGRKTLQPERKDTAAKDMKAMAEALKGESWRQRAIRTSEQKRKPKPVADVQAKVVAKVKAKAARDTKGAMKTVEANAKKLLQLGAINQTQYDAMMQALRHA